MFLVMFGAPGIGKGTISGMLSKHLKVPHISSGDIIRQEIKLKTEPGIKAEPFVEKGLLVPDDLVIDLIKDRVKQDDCKNGLIFDGFPRTIPQAKHLDKTDIKIRKVINFIASQETIIQRISGRRICKKCQAIFHITNIPPKKEGICDNCGSELYQRKDDQPESVKKRLKVYEKQTKPLIEYYTKKGMIANIDTEKPIPDIFKDTLNAISEYSKEHK